MVKCYKKDDVFRRRAYLRWQHIKDRCYDKNDDSYKSYGLKGAILCDEWLKFNSFYEWFKSNYYEVEGELMAIDKDILVTDNKIYSPTTCLIVPFRINGLLVHKFKGVDRGIQKRNGGFEVKIRNVLTGKNEYYGKYTDIITASNVYKLNKQRIVHDVIKTYENRIPDNIYDILIHFEL